MNKKDFINIIAKKLDCKDSEAKKIIDVILGTILDTVIDGDTVNLKGFGKFLTRKKAPRKSFNINTSKIETIPAYTTFVFKSGTTAKRVVKNKFK